MMSVSLKNNDADYVAFDVETANNCAGSICSIGLAYFNNNKLASKYYSLVRPPDEFGDFNYYCVSVHGLTADILSDQPTFAEIYSDIEDFIGNNLLVAHNAPFDSRHFHAALAHTGINRSYDFACTLSLARRTLSLSTYKFDVVCKHLGVPLENYHNALSDAIACGKVYAALKDAL
ncbi:MAG: 3'-5' exoribonuclease [Coriobacteriales bacterium]|jgi:DNA polymerase-3 subunit epsilon|nr:3'-5' exoribonuclease [Coriobacteriales bacterium]